PDGTMLLVVTKAEQARIYDIATGELKTNVGDAGELQAAHFSHNGQLLAQADRYGNLDVRNLETGTSQQLVEQPQGTPFEAIVFSHDDKTLFATNRWGQVSAWSLDSGELLFSHKVEKAIDTLVVS